MRIVHFNNNKNANVYFENQSEVSQHTELLNELKKQYLLSIVIDGTKDAKTTLRQVLTN